MAMGGFELAVVGDGGAFSNLTPGGYKVNEGELFPTDPTQNPADPTKKWTLGNQTIQWGMTGKNNFGNFTGEVDGTQIEAEGIRPGLNGSMSFYVIPREAGPLTIRFQVKIIPLELTNKLDMNSDLKEIKEDERLEGAEKEELDRKLTAVRLLHGHLLFACPRYADGQLVENARELVNYTDGSFTIDFGSIAEENVGKPIALWVDWFWPNTQEEATSNTDFGSTIDGWMKTDPTSFFYRPDSSETNGERAFDDADKYIGDMIDALILKLDAKKIG